MITLDKKMMGGLQERIDIEILKLNIINIQKTK